MRHFGNLLLLGVLPVLAIGLASPVLAQQGRQRRVFTNEDVASPAPPAPAPEPAAKAAPGAETASPADAKAAAPAAAGTPGEAEAAAEDAPPTPKEQLKRMTDAQTALRYVLDEFNKREQSETVAAAQAQWREMTQCLLSVMQANQRIVNELQEQVKQLESAPAPPAPATSPAPAQ